MLLVDFNLTLSIRESLSRIQVASEQLDPYVVLPYEFSGELRRTVLAESVHFSTMIEGNSLTLAQVETVLAGGVVRAPRAEIQEVENYRDAMSYVQLVSAEPGNVITEETIRSIHFLVSKNLDTSYAPGRYRTEQNFVVDRRTGRRAYFPPAPEQVGSLMGEFVAWLNSRHEYPIPVEAALAHLNFVSIHPFVDSNGGTARILESLVMYKGGFRSQELVSLESFYARDQLGYYAALASAQVGRFSPPKDVTSWVEYNLEGHAKEAELAVIRIQENVAEIDDLSRALAELGLSVESIGALWYACRRGRISNREYRSVTGRSSQAAISEFNSLLYQGLLVRVGRGRSTAYAPSGLLRRTYGGIGSEDDQPTEPT